MLEFLGVGDDWTNFVYVCVCVCVGLWVYVVQDHENSNITMHVCTRADIGTTITSTIRAVGTQHHLVMPVSDASPFHTIATAILKCQHDRKHISSFPHF